MSDERNDDSNLTPRANEYQIRNPFLSMTHSTPDTNEQVEEPVPFVSLFQVDYDLKAPEAALLRVKSTRIIVEFELKKLIRGFR